MSMEITIQNNKKVNQRTWGIAGSQKGGFFADPMFYLSLSEFMTLHFFFSEMSKTLLDRYLFYIIPLLS